MQPKDRSTKQTILIVEDDDDTRRVYSLMLRHYGFRVVEAATGGEAVQYATEDLPDLILMDMNLPMFDGWEAARRIKSDPISGAVPLVAFSALVDSIADLRSDKAPFDGFIAKPVSPGELVRRVAAYCELLGSPRSARRPMVKSRAASRTSPAAPA
jgi:two-component system cell cycle response regulator DivK